MRVAIDANVYLDFYRLPSNDLTEMRKLVQYLVDRKVVLYATQQIWDEVDRRREKVIAEALKVARDKRAPSGLPQLVRHYEQWEDLENALDAYSKAHQALIAAAETDARNRDLQADSVLDALRAEATLLQTSLRREKTHSSVLLLGTRPGNPVRPAMRSPGRPSSKDTDAQKTCIL